MVVAAYLLVLQATLTGLTLGAHAAPKSGDFAGVLCSTSVALTDASDAPSKPQAPPNCCVMGCSMLGGGTAPTPTAAFTAPRLGVSPAASVAAPFDVASRSPDLSPRNTRAPPPAA